MYILQTYTNGVIRQGRRDVVPQLIMQIFSNKICTIILLLTVLYMTLPNSFCLCLGLTSQSTIFQLCRDGATASWVINQYFRGVKCLAQGHNTAEVGFEPPTSRSESDTLPLSHRAPLPNSCFDVVHDYPCSLRYRLLAKNYSLLVFCLL